jgi:hypothetical protein
MDLGSQTIVVNGQRFNQPTWSQYSPMGYGPQTTGVPQVSPTMPPYIGASNTGGALGAGATNVGGYGTADNNSTVTAIAAANPFNARVSPLWWAIGLLILGLLLLNGVHWRKVTLGGAEEHAHVGSVEEHAGANAG